MTHVLVPLIEGFEEIEAITIVDVLRRGEIKVILASVNDTLVKGSHDIVLQTDVLLQDVKAEDLTAIVLPGGPGVKALQENELLRQMLQAHYRSGKLTAAICAAPLVLSKADILQDKKVTSYPSVKDQLDCGTYLTDPVVIDGNLVTSRGPGTAMAFSLALVEILLGRAKADSLAATMIVS